MGCSSIRKKRAISKRRNFFWRREVTYEETFQDLLKSCLYFGGSLESSNVLIKMKWGLTTEIRGSLVKLGKMSPVGHFVHV